MKNIIKKFLCYLIVFFGINLNLYAASYAKEETSANFNFIKSEEDENDNFIYDGSLLLYGGIALIIVSITGMILVIIPRNKKKNIHSKSKYNRMKK